MLTLAISAPVRIETDTEITSWLLDPNRYWQGARNNWHAADLLVKLIITNASDNTVDIDYVPTVRCW